MQEGISVLEISM